MSATLKLDQIGNTTKTKSRKIAKFSQLTATATDSKFKYKQPPSLFGQNSRFNQHSISCNPAKLKSMNLFKKQQNKPTKISTSAKSSNVHRRCGIRPFSRKHNISDRNHVDRMKCISKETQRIGRTESD